MNIYAYWDQPAHIPAYLQLYITIWRRHDSIDEVYLISADNLHEWIGEGVLNMTVLQAYPIAQRKDAIEIAILARYGGFVC
ncbi:MAG: hypothetical protein IPG06_13695 [Haliea sp.]|nr:hypothetical protein [Haliea sp.]